MRRMNHFEMSNIDSSPLEASLQAVIRSPLEGSILHEKKEKQATTPRTRSPALNYPSKTAANPKEKLSQGAKLFPSQLIR